MKISWCASRSLGLAAVLLLGTVACASSPAPSPQPTPAAGAARGHLLIVGGGPIPDAILDRFVALAGGSQARIAVFPMASEDPDAGIELTETFRKLGANAERIVVTHEQADTDTAAERLKGVTGIWFGGGDQVRLTGALRGTRTESAIHERFRAGAVVGGTSAGAAVMSSPMITGDEKKPGGDRPLPKDSPDAWVTIAREDVATVGGFDLIPGAIVDQHFVRRRRNNRLLSVVLEHPERVGVGIDESTALEVLPDGTWRVLGASVAVVFDARTARITPPTSKVLGAQGIRLNVLPAGSRFDPKTGEATLP
ncbi:MAG TPA: cyanophycinase [Thermoanaerobaculia bacterium]|jgi:cyanophycinase